MSKESLQALEADLTELKKKLELASNQRNIAKSLLKSSQKDVETLTKSVDHHYNNLKHMTSDNADVVDLSEFIKIKSLYLGAKDDLTIAKQQVSQATKAISAMEIAINTTGIEIKAVLNELGAYGELVPFPKKMQ